MALCKIDLDGLALPPWMGRSGGGGDRVVVAAVAVPAPAAVSIPSQPTQSMCLHIDAIRIV